MDEIIFKDKDGNTKLELKGETLVVIKDKSEKEKEETDESTEG